jgi:hypothetical protein
MASHVSKAGNYPVKESKDRLSQAMTAPIPADATQFERAVIEFLRETIRRVDGLNARLKIIYFTQG